MSEETPPEPEEQEDDSVPQVYPEGFLHFVFTFLRYPTRTWELIAQNRNPKASEFLRYYLPALILLLTGSVGGFLTFGAYAPVQDEVTGDLKIVHVYLDAGPLIAQQLVFGFFYLLLPFVLAKPLSYLTKLFARVEEINGEKIGTVRDARRFILLSSVPVIAASAFQAIPPLSLISFFVTFYGIYIFYKGIHPMLGIAQKSVWLYFCISIVAIFFYTTVAHLLSDDIAGNPLLLAVEELSGPTVVDSGSKQ